MSEGYQHHHNNQQGIFSFPAPNGFVDRAADQQQAAGVLHPGIYESATAAETLSEMFNFAGVTPLDLHPRSLTPPPHHHHHQPPSTHMLLPSQGFHGHQTHFTWVAEGGGGGNGLSLSLSSSKAEAEAEERMMFFSNQEILGSSSTSFKNLGNQMHLQGYGHNQANFGFGLSSKYTRPAQELLEEFCSVGRVHLKKNKSAASTSGGGAGPSNSGKDPPPLSPPDRMEHQRRKVKLLAMLDEVERRYKHYWSEMQMVVNTYDIVMGVGASIPYTGLAQKAMSRHFRCLKEAIEAQLKHSCEVLGEKDVTGLTKGETPRLKVLEQSLRQQRGFHQMGMMEQEAWRPQRGLPERSVNILRAWLFEHFLNPYPSDADKHLLARQTGLSRNQVSNWFINARVRLWKPMVEEMYQKEAKEDEEDIEEGEREKENDAQTSTHDSATTPTTRTKTRAEERGIRSEINADDSDPTLFAINTVTSSFNPIADDAADACTGGGNMPGSTLIRFGAGDVSLTLGLRHSAAGGGKQPETSFSFRDFAS